MTNQDTYRETATYFAAIDELEATALSFVPGDEQDLRFNIIRIVGEMLGVWPTECSPDNGLM